MIKKEFTPKKTQCKVTFTLPADVAANEVAVLGDFNNWDPSSDKLTKKKGEWTGSVKVKPAEYAFRYLVDGQTWLNDEAADAFVVNEFGSENGVIKAVI